MAGIGSMLGGAAQGLQFSAQQGLEERKHADEMALKNEQMGMARKAAGRAEANDARAQVDGVVNQLWETIQGMSSAAQSAGHSPQETAPLLQPLYQQAHELLTVAGRAQEAKALEARFGALTSVPTANTTPKFDKSGVDDLGHDIYTQVNPAAAGGVREMRNPKQSADSGPIMDENGVKLAGKPALEALRARDEGTATLVQKIVSGEMAPPSAYAFTKEKEYWSKILGYAQQVDPGFDFTLWESRSAGRKAFSSQSPNAPATIIGNGRTALQHLAELSDHALELDNYNTGLPGNDLMNAARNRYKKSSGNSGAITAFSEAGSKFTEEGTRLYRGAGGAEADIQRDLKTIEPTLSPPELAHSMQTKKNLMLSKIQSLQQRWVDTVGPLAKPYPIIDGETQQALNRLDLNIAKLNGLVPKDAKELPPGFVNPGDHSTKHGAQGTPLSEQQKIQQTDIENAKAAIAKAPHARAAVIDAIRKRYGEEAAAGL